uniref:Uncharacterized protein n=1 Tax=Ixodes ricinus TaxID=34613 RepID=A0A6B0UZ60_IXORI
MPCRRKGRNRVQAASSLRGSRGRHRRREQVIELHATKVPSATGAAALPPLHSPGPQVFTPGRKCRAGVSTGISSTTRSVRGRIHARGGTRTLRMVLPVWACLSSVSRPIPTFAFESSALSFFLTTLQHTDILAPSIGDMRDQKRRCGGLSTTGQTTGVRTLSDC